MPDNDDLITTNTVHVDLDSPIAVMLHEHPLELTTWGGITAYGVRPDDEPPVWEYCYGNIDGWHPLTRQNAAAQLQPGRLVLLRPYVAPAPATTAVPTVALDRLLSRIEGRDGGCNTPTTYELVAELRAAMGGA